eukprot:755592-Hanusia_phi.AAC.4
MLRAPPYLLHRRHPRFHPLFVDPLTTTPRNPNPTPINLTPPAHHLPRALPVSPLLQFYPSQTHPTPLNQGS